MIELTLRRRQTTEPSFNVPAMGSPRVATLRSCFVAAFVTITTLVVFIPFNPQMPDSRISQEWISAIKQFRSQPEESMRRELPRIDESWGFALNAATARHMRFGKQIIFTGGPYASIYTRSFYPSTDRLMIFGSLLLGISYALALLYLGHGRKVYTILAFMLFFAAFPQRDALLLSYPFVLVLCALKFANSDKSSQRASVPWGLFLAIGVMLSACGLLPLIKGSLLVPAGVSVLLLDAILFCAIPRTQAIPLFFITPLASVVFWAIAGQSPFDLPDFVRGTMWLTSGYTDAMSLSWKFWPKIVGTSFVVFYLVVSALICFSLFRRAVLSSKSMWVLGFLCAVFLPVAFKHGCVRSDEHLLIAFVSLAIILFTLSLLYVDRYIIGSLVAVVIVVVGISFRQDPVLRTEVGQSFGTGTTTDWGYTQRRAILGFIWKRAPEVLSRITCENTVIRYANAWRGIWLRLSDSDSLRKRFEMAIANIQREYTVPVTEGTVDIYSYEQAIPIASGVNWNPRPIFQSYSAYTPKLAQINEQHVRSASVPDWVLVDLLAIDGRLPLLEDGLSWPALLDNYAVSSFDGQFLLMHRNGVVHSKSDVDVIYQKKQSLGATVTLPDADEPLFAEVDLKPTLLGRLLTVLLNPPQLNMVVKLRNGSSGKYRVISDMMKSGFIVSPLVRNTEEFAALATGDRHFKDEAKVASISIEPSYGGSIFWANTYRLTLKTYHRQPAQGS